jgi:hypothetical protein
METWDNPALIFSDWISRIQKMLLHGHGCRAHCAQMACPCTWTWTVCADTMHFVTVPHRSHIWYV